MSVILSLATAVGDVLAAPFGSHAGWALAVWSALFGLVAIVLFKYGTPQKRLAAARDRLIGRLLEAALYQSSLRTIVRVQAAVLVANLRYLMFALPALVVLVVPLLLVLPQLESRLGREPLPVDATALVSVGRDGSVPVELATAPGLQVEAGPVQDAGRGELVWRVRATAPGRHELRVVSGDQTETLAVPVATAGELASLTAGRHRNLWTQVLYDPAAPPLPADGALTHLTIELPAREVRMFGVATHWLIGFTVLSLAGGLLLKKPLKVEI